jgi:hypothetical protein
MSCFELREKSFQPEDRGISGDYITKPPEGSGDVVRNRDLLDCVVEEVAQQLG